MERSINSREIILDVLLHHEKSGEHSHKLIYQTLQKYQYLPGNERAFLKRVIEGSIEYRIQLDYILNYYSSVKVNKMKPLVRTLLRMSVYQLLYLDQVPDSAICNEAVKLAGKRGFQNLKGFINGVLRKIAREKNEISYPKQEGNEVQYLSVLYSMPEWLIQLWIASYGFVKTKEMLEAFIAIKPVSLRVKRTSSKEERDDWVQKLTDKGVNLIEHPYHPLSYLAKNTEQIASLDGYDEGFFTVQDVSSTLSVLAAGIKEGDMVLDICGAPGGKSLLAAELVGDKGSVTTRDVSEYKANQIIENKERMKAHNLKVEVWDGTIEDPLWREKADVVIADVPCSGLGVIGKKSDIKYRITKESLEEIVALQKEIIASSVSYVKKGGILLYSTCTINKNENEQMVQWICNHYPFELESLDEYLIEQLHTEESSKGYLQLFPTKVYNDGFFIARLKRK